MAPQINRMQFLRGDFSTDEILRPPWALQEADFVEQCDRCDACLKACPSKIIKRGRAGFPEVDFKNAGCDFCEACVNHCHTSALSLSNNNQSDAWQLTSFIKNNCLSENGVVCRACGDVCETQAIQFKMIVGGSALLEMATEKCNGCGECVSLCPVHAIEIKHQTNNQSARI